ncbi:L-fuculose-phosphate aldolase [Proteiniclasticum sp. SCR006]|uniref:L-fuculose-phosphate aldolase n=1 Tax=Proteiniclasticum aestuarii TaxID=2817862 RepID=A0A939KL91_9CLOT|nr:L-fuculose-phosphate aldolase [Proteiniclasticum aestuarii]MBO1265440.1 L-fuculose-phosphate aldolase [Proteiniclasticum aestuarii]
MLMERERKEIVEYGKKLITSGLTKGTGGNISIFNREENLMAISPSGIDYFETNPEDVVIMDLDGKVVDGDKKPSSEYAMHSIFYKKRDDIDAVVHTHSVYSTVLATLRTGLPASSYLVAFSGLDVRCAEYASFGTKELAENAFKAMEDRYAVFLANHGLLTGAQDLANAFNKAEEIEHCAEVYYRAKSIGDPVILDEEEMYRMIEKFNTYGQVKK